MRPSGPGQWHGTRAASLGPNALSLCGEKLPPDDGATFVDTEDLDEPKACPACWQVTYDEQTTYFAKAGQRARMRLAAQEAAQAQVDKAIAETGALRVTPQRKPETVRGRPVLDLTPRKRHDA